MHVCLPVLMIVHEFALLVQFASILSVLLSVTAGFSYESKNLYIQITVTTH